MTEAYKYGIPLDTSNEPVTVIVEYHIVTEEERRNPAYVAGPKDVWQSEGPNPFYLYRNTAFHIVPNPDGGFISSFFDDYSNDPKLASLNETSYDSTTVDDAIKHWVETIWAATR